MSFKRLSRRKKRADSLLKAQCKGCRFFGMCKGGCPLEGAMRENNLMDKTEYCEFYKNLWGHISESVNAKRPNKV